MTKPSEQGPSRKRGRPTAYKAEYVEQARKLCELGATDVELADFFKVSIRTISDWRVRHADFLQALNLGKEVADKRVTTSLYQRAMGYTFDAEKIFMPAGSKQPVRVAYREHVPPDTTACIFWLKNRQPEDWRDRQQHEHTGKNGGPIQTVDLSKATDEQLAALEAIFGTAAFTGSDDGSDQAGEAAKVH